MPGARIIRLAAAIAVVLVLASPLAGQVAKAASDQGTATPIKHVIMITMENHSFDNLMGKYPFNPYGNQSIIANVTAPADLSGVSNSSLMAVSPGSFSTGNPHEGYNAYHIDWNNGSMNGFLKGSGKNSMYYYTASQMAMEWDLIQQYAMGDMYFASTLSETVPNRLYEIAGYSPVINDYGPPPYIPLNSTIFHQLSSDGVSWGYYINSTASGLGILSMIRGISQYSGNIHNWGTFYSQLANGSLPAVSWLEPVQGGGEKYSQHPSYNMLIGQLWLLYTITAIMKSPLWNSTAIMVNYDENGGYYDHVAPPSVSGSQLGFRVPFFIISPYAKEDYVSSTVMTHTSLLAFVEYNWHLPALNPLVQASNIPMDLFNFNSTYSGGVTARAPYEFPASINSIIPSSYNFGSSAFAGLSNISALFPLQFQYPVNDLPYSTSGFSNITLKSQGTGVKSSSDVSLIPFYESSTAVGAVLVAGSAILYLSARTMLRRKK